MRIPKSFPTPLSFSLYIFSKRVQFCYLQGKVKSKQEKGVDFSRLGRTHVISFFLEGFDPPSF